MTPETTGQFDVVYSWGVLPPHRRYVAAIETAAKLVKPGGQFMIADLRKRRRSTRLDGRKAHLLQGTRAVNGAMRHMFIGALFSAQLLRGQQSGRTDSRAPAPAA